MKTIDVVITEARKYLGVPYKYGALMNEAPEVFDCSGFIKFIFGAANVELPRSTIEQAREGVKVEHDNLQAGDLIFMRGDYGHYSPDFPNGIGHVGVYTNNGTVLHAASERLSEKPIIEKGQVLESSLEEYLTGWAPMTVIRRVI